MKKENNTNYGQLLMIGLIFMLIPAQVQSCGRTTEPAKKAVAEKKAVPSRGEQKEPAEEAEEAAPGAETMELTLYFADEQSMYLLPEKRVVSRTEAVARTALAELIEGPEQAGHVKTIPAGTRLLGVKIENGLASVDFSREFVDNHPGGSAGETMTIYSIVNTLTELSTVQRVRFLVEGNAIETLAEHMDLTQPLGRKEDIIKK